MIASVPHSRRTPLLLIREPFSQDETEFRDYKENVYSVKIWLELCAQKHRVDRGCDGEEENALGERDECRVEDSEKPDVDLSPYDFPKAVSIVAWYE